jgi:hypothetical protein
MGDDVLYVGGGNLHLLKTVLDAADGVSDVGEPATIEDGFLNARHAAEAVFLADLTNLAEESEVKD